MADSSKISSSDVSNEESTEDLESLSQDTETSDESTTSADSGEDRTDPNGLDDDDFSEHISKSGNKVFDEEKARENVGKVHNRGTTLEFIQIITPRIPGLEAALRADAAAKGLADGSIKREDHVAKMPEKVGDASLMGGDASKGNSITDATAPSSDPSVNPASGPVHTGTPSGNRSPIAPQSEDEGQSNPDAPKSDMDLQRPASDSTSEVESDSSGSPSDSPNSDKAVEEAGDSQDVAGTEEPEGEPGESESEASVNSDDEADEEDEPVLTAKLGELV